MTGKYIFWLGWHIGLELGPSLSYYISGQVPYKGKTLPSVINFICDQKGHLDVPKLCPDELKGQLTKCWSYDPNERPSFDSLLQLIQQQQLLDI